jgi:hypothetical protein
LSSKKKKKFISNDWKVTFLRGRDPLAITYINQLLLQISNPSLSKSKKNWAKKRLKAITWFDQRTYRRFLIKLRKFVTLTLNVDISASLSYVVRTYERLCVTKGEVEAVKLFKQLHDIYIRIITSNSFECSDFMKANSRGEPYLLGPLLELAHGSLDERRAGLHAIQVIKLVGVWDTTFSTESVTQDPPIPLIPLDEKPVVGKYLQRFISKFGSKSGTVDLDQLTRAYKETLEDVFPGKGRRERLIAIRRMSKSLHVSGKNGPNGPCLTTVVIDHSSLTPLQSGDGTLYTAIKEMAILTNNSPLLKFMLDFDEDVYLWSTSKKGRKPIDSKLSIKEEPWAKRRVFAIVDWFSQSVLKGFHAYLFRWLEAQGEDGTFNQDRVSEIVRLWSADPGSNPESADLSAATDSIPVEVQAEIVQQIAGAQFAMLWRCICCDRNFQVPNSTDTVRYSTGQPMGILSSWAMLSVWHHIVCRTCLRYLDIERNADDPAYTVIGDDVCLNGTDIFKIYQEFVGVVHGVGISKSKGFHKETQTSNNPIPTLGDNYQTTAEFAKRIFYNGQEISVVPPNELFSAFDSATQFPALIDSIVKRGYPCKIDHESVPNLTSLCHHKKLALILATNPLSRCAQIGVTPVSSNLVLENVPWFDPGFNVEIFKDIFTEVLKGQLISTLGGTLQRINNWISFAVNNPEVKVKVWSYECMTASKLICHIAQQMAVQVADSESECMKSFTAGSNSWLSAKKFLQSIHICFELDELFKERPKTKVDDRYQFLNKQLATAIKLTLGAKREADITLL